jgi:hypothetical protein
MPFIHFSFGRSESSKVENEKQISPNVQHQRTINSTEAVITASIPAMHTTMHSVQLLSKRSTMHISQNPQSATMILSDEPQNLD